MTTALTNFGFKRNCDYLNVNQLSLDYTNLFLSETPGLAIYGLATSSLALSSLATSSLEKFGLVACSFVTSSLPTSRLAIFRPATSSLATFRLPTSNLAPSGQAIFTEIQATADGQIWVQTYTLPTCEAYKTAGDALNLYVVFSGTSNWLEGCELPVVVLAPAYRALQVFRGPSYGGAGLNLDSERPHC